MTDWILNFATHIIDKNIVVVYFLFFLVSFMQMIFPPIPGDVLLAFEGYLTVISKNIHFVPILINSAAANFLGSICVYWFGYKNGEKVFNFGLINRFVPQKRRDQTKKLFKQYGYMAIIISKFLLGINAIIVLFSGIFKVKPRIVYLSLFISILFHHLLYIAIGRFLANYVYSFKTMLSNFNMILLVITVLVLGIGLLVMVKAQKKKDG